MVGYAIVISSRWLREHHVRSRQREGERAGDCLKLGNE